MIGYFTSNEISQAVMQAVAKGGYAMAPVNTKPYRVPIEIKHISEFKPDYAEEKYPCAPCSTSIFYGLLRGTGNAMKICQFLREDFYYIDNGYTGAEYIDAKGAKYMDGKLRICKNDMTEVYPGPRIEGPISEGKAFLLIPPSPYTANFYDTTPEDWTQEWGGRLKRKGFTVEVKGKERGQTFAFYFDWVERHKGAVLAFNSMAVMGSMERGIPTYDTHGILRNAGDIQTENFRPMVNVNFASLKAYYEARQFTLQEIAEGKSCL